ncbi:MAG: hypothetical protein QNJ74_24335 [Trichodesmium sp. MO_231.B1]|nr:hypothetical protein [Trichodesmium sp. MO_231.B1]
MIKILEVKQTFASFGGALIATKRHELLPELNQVVKREWEVLQV